VFYTEAAPFGEIGAPVGPAGGFSAGDLASPAALR
jgi:hypothetical protein